MYNFGDLLKLFENTPTIFDSLIDLLDKEVGAIREKKMEDVLLQALRARHIESQGDLIAYGYIYVILRDQK